MLRYAISDRSLFPGDDGTRQQRLLRQGMALAHEGVDYFQLREKDLDDDTLLTLTCTLRDVVARSGGPMRLVLNGPQPIAQQAGVLWHGIASSPAHPSQSTSVHTLEEVEQYRSRTELLLFGPVFGKSVANRIINPGTGVEILRQAVQRAAGTPVLALGGVTGHNARLCLEAGAAGIAAIRLFLR